jgi:hypothetical protein
MLVTFFIQPEASPETQRTVIPVVNDVFHVVSLFLLSVYTDSGRMSTKKAEHMLRQFISIKERQLIVDDFFAFSVHLLHEQSIQKMEHKQEPLLLLDPLAATSNVQERHGLSGHHGGWKNTIPTLSLNKLDQSRIVTQRFSANTDCFSFCIAL